MGVWETLESATAATILPASGRGVGFGLLATINGVGDFLSSSLVGLFWALAPVAAMSFVILASLLGAVMIACARPVAIDLI
jgi:hypothetical protein